MQGSHTASTCVPQQQTEEIKGGMWLSTEGAKPASRNRGTTTLTQAYLRITTPLITAKIKETLPPKTCPNTQLHTHTHAIHPTQDQTRSCGSTLACSCTGHCGTVGPCHNGDTAPLLGSMLVTSSRSRSYATNCTAAPGAVFRQLMPQPLNSCLARPTGPCSDMCRKQWM